MTTPSTTRTGNFPIGFRRAGGWQKDPDALITWARENHFAALDLTSGPLADDLPRVTAAGLRIGSVDLGDGSDWKALISPDKDRRAGAITRTLERIKTCTALGARNFFAVLLPEDPARPRSENFALMLEGYAALVPALEAADAHVVVEGWPGPGALCCTPEGYRALLRELPGSAIGINYDPSHLVRMGIDPLRFLREFAPHVYHVHAKDAILADADALYEFGREQPPTFATPPAYGAIAWRYTIPGHGQTSWVNLLRTLVDTGYRGAVSVELEDATFHGSEEAEKRGLLLARQFLEGC